MSRKSVRQHQYKCSTGHQNQKQLYCPRLDFLFRIGCVLHQLEHNANTGYTVGGSLLRPLLSRWLRCHSCSAYCRTAVLPLWIGRHVLLHCCYPAVVVGWSVGGWWVVDGGWVVGAWWVAARSRSTRWRRGSEKQNEPPRVSRVVALFLLRSSFHAVEVHNTNPLRNAKPSYAASRKKNIYIMFVLVTRAHSCG